MSTISTNDFQKGTFINFRNEPHQIVSVEFYNPGKGSAVYRTRLKNLKNQRVLDFTFKSGDTAEEIDVETREMQYLYRTDNKYFFMNPVTFEQMQIPGDLLGNLLKLVKEGEIYQLILYEGNALSIRAPKKVVLKVTQSSDSARGNTVGAPRKLVTLETGLQVLAPLFIKEGDELVIDVDSLEYVERVSRK